MLNCFKAYLRPKVIFPSYIKDFEIYCVCMLSCFSHVQLFANLWSPPGSSVHGILQARILEWVAMPSAMGSSWPRDRTWVFYISCTGRQVLCHLGNLLTALQFVLVQCTTSSQRCNTKESWLRICINCDQQGKISLGPPNTFCIGCLFTSGCSRLCSLWLLSWAQQSPTHKKQLWLQPSQPAVTAPQTTVKS